MLEIFTACCGLMQSILIMFNKKENWLFYMANILSLTVFSFFAHLYGDVLENIVYVSFGLFGLLTWYSDKISTKIFGKVNQIKYCSLKERLFYIGMLCLISTLMYFWLKSTNDPAPFLDAVTTGMGFTATLMMAFKRVESWIIWFVDDILMAYIYYSLPERAFWLMALNIIWIGLAVGTWYTWHKEAIIKREEVEKEGTMIDLVGGN